MGTQFVNDVMPTMQTKTQNRGGEMTTIPPSLFDPPRDPLFMVTCQHCKTESHIDDCDCLGAGDSGDLYCPNCNGTIPDEEAR